MKRAISATLSIGVLVGLAILLLGLPGSGAQVYSPVQARAQSSRHPAAWRGRIVLLRAVAFPMAGTYCPTTEPNCDNVLLMQSETDTSLDDALIATPPQRWPDRWALLRRVPLLDRLLGPPPTIDWGRSAVYRVQFTAEWFRPCLAPCLAPDILGLAD